MQKSAEAVLPHSVTTHSVAPRGIEGRYKISVYQPIRRADGSERFPVVYATDADLFFDGLVAAANLLHLLGDAERFVMVGIGYENSGASELLRWRDFAPS